MSEMVERALAAFLTKAAEIGVVCHVHDEPQRRLAECMRAAIEAMRKPTLAMWEAADAAEKEYDRHEALPYSYAWFIMIAAALAEPQSLEKAKDLSVTSHP